MANNNSNNGWKVSVAEFRGFMKAKIEAINNRQDEFSIDMKTIKEDISDIKLSIAVSPQNCIQIEPMAEVKAEIQTLKDSETKRNAVKTLMVGVWGIIGGALFLLLREVVKKIL